VEYVRNKLHGVKQGTPQDVSEDGNFGLSKPSGHYMYHQFNIHNSTFCPQCVYVFCVDMRTNSDYFTVQH
jgi:hypothetical protein